MTLLTLAMLGLVFSVVIFLYYAGQTPDPSAISARRISESTKIYDRTGETLLYDIHGEEKRTIIPWDQIPETVKKATLISEDADFYSHKGIDFRGILRAFYKDVTNLSASQGGSTITQQLIKNSLLGKEKTMPRKIKEAVLSIQIERNYSKDKIFWMYLNQIPYGSNAYGIEAASQTFFDKPAKDLNWSEAALLASLPKAPSYYSPYGNHFPELIAKRDNLLERMKNAGIMTQTEYETAIQETPDIKPSQESITAPHFVIMVRDYLIKKYGEDMVQNGGLHVTTTLDAKLQKIAEGGVETEGVVEKYAKINTEKYKANNAALVSADPKTGQILAMVGSKDYFGKPEPEGCTPGKDCKFEGNFNTALAFRQPGSSFKPFAYSVAFNKGFTDSTILFDLPTEFNPDCESFALQEKDENGQDCYHPQNYNGRFRGPTTMRQALGQSLNLPSVKTLYLAGIDDTIDLAHQMGITTLNDRSRFGLSLVLGGGEVKLVDMVNAYSVFANDGVRVLPAFLLKVIAADGTILEEYKKEEERVLDPQIARLITDVLSDNNARGPVFGYNSPLYFPERPVAAKTGTTQENRDGWLIGYTPSLVTGIWTGNNNNDSMTKEGAGLSAAAPMWHEFMARALADTPVEQFIKPDPIITDKIMLNGDYNGPSGIHTILFYVNKNDPAGSYPSNPSDDSQFSNWEASVQRWLVSSAPASSPSPSPLP
ncbi:MAG: PBP1A family penicillin-binding protein [Candidatus Yanofskybacteria bacterium]|nr:PBP1A family penicillin-binding protein [Candidatus Yanofskybacteria bacterium]